MKLANPRLILLGALAAAGCTGSTDPRTATVFDNFQNIQSGEYDRQIAAKEAQAAAIVRANQAQRTQIASLESQRGANQATIASLNSEIARVRQEAASARSQLQGDPAKLTQLSALETQINAVESDVRSGSTANARQELRSIRGAIRALSN